MTARKGKASDSDSDSSVAKYIVQLVKTEIYADVNLKCQQKQKHKQRQQLAQQ